MRGLLIALAGACACAWGVAASGCSSSPPAPAPDSGPHPTPGVCHPDPTGTGNSKNVGAYCTPGAGQCENFPMSPLCSIDLDPKGSNFCIRLCHLPDDCGEGACCTGRIDNGPKACVPLTCLVPEGQLCPPVPYPDASVDSGNDAGTDTGVDPGQDAASSSG
jgi:hypothetical protein